MTTAGGTGGRGRNSSAVQTEAGGVASNVSAARSLFLLNLTAGSLESDWRGAGRGRVPGAAAVVPFPRQRLVTLHLAETCNVTTGRVTFASLFQLQQPLAAFLCLAHPFFGCTDIAAVPHVEHSGDPLGPYQGLHGKPRGQYLFFG